MNSCFVCERVSSDHGLVRGWFEADEFGEQLAGGIEPIQYERMLAGKLVLAYKHGCSYFFESRVACALADAVDRALDLLCPGGDRSQSIGYRHTKVVVAMR